MDDKLTIELSDGIYNHIKGLQNIAFASIEEAKRLSNNFNATINRFTVLWILTLIDYWFK